MAITTLGRELIRSKLPEKYKNRADGVFNNKYTAKLMTDIALEDPDAYVDILQELNNLGQAFVSTYGRDAALQFKDMKVSTSLRNFNQQLRALTDRILDDPNLTPEQKEAKIKEIGYKYSQKVQDVVFQDHDKRNTALANQINSGSRGNKVQLMQLQFGNMMMKDAMDRDIPYIMMHPYANGISPMAYWVSASSGRKGFYDVQAATGQAGYLGKLVTAVTHGTVIEKEDCGTTDTGVPFPANSDKNIGAVLLRSFHKWPAGSIVTQEMVDDADDTEEMVLRSPITCKCKYGICSKCNGLGENGKFPGEGEYVSLNAARSFVEAVTQGGISCLHPGTPVRMADWSIKAIKDIVAGDVVMGVDTNGMYSPTTVVRTFDNGLQEMYLTKYRKGYKTKNYAALVSTLTHKALQCTNKTNCKDAVNNNIHRILEVGYKTRDISMVPARGPADSLPGEQVDEALFLGLMLGDGCYTENAGLTPHFSCADPSLIEQTVEYMKKLGIRFVFHKGSKCYWRVVNNEQVNKCGEVRPLNPAKLLLKKHGLWGKYSWQKSLPETWNTWNTQSALSLLSGLIITDGSLFRIGNTLIVSYASTSCSLVQQVSELIAKHLGVHASKIHINKGKRKRPLYSVEYARVVDVLKLLDNLKLYGIKEARRVEFISELNQRLSGSGNIMHMATWKRMSQTYLGSMPSVDIEVDNDSHLFLLANGLVVSNSKHKGGVGGQKNTDPDGEDQPTGFRNLERMIMAPKAFPGGAVLAPADGVVSGIQKAPQGGTYVIIGTNTVYCSPERAIKVKIGDKLSAGDIVTNGVPNPDETTSLKGLGAGRRYFTDKLNQILTKQGWGTDRRNLEAFTRSMISKVKITDPDGYKQYLPGDIADYNEIIADYEPPEDSREEDVSKAANMYLQKPVLYYSVGTRITPDVIKELKKYDFTTVSVSEKAPPFTAQFLRPASVLQNDKNWLPRLSGERLRDGLFDAARRGITDSYDSPSYVNKIVAAPFKP